jgi:hypothetical protein
MRPRRTAELAEGEAVMGLSQLEYAHRVRIFPALILRRSVPYWHDLR